MPHEGFPFPRVWLLRINIIAIAAKQASYNLAPNAKDSWATITQIFAGAISAAVRHNFREELDKIAWIVRGALLGKIKDVGLDVGDPKCSNLSWDIQ